MDPTIPPPPWRSGNTQITQVGGPDVTQPIPGADASPANIPPPPWKDPNAIDPTAGDKLHGMLQQLGATSDNFLQQADAEAHAEITRREKGMGTDADGVFHEGVNAPVKLSMNDKLAIIQAHRERMHVATEQQDMNDMANQIKATSMANNTPIENFGGALGTGLARFGTGVVGIAAPKTAANLNENIAGGYSFDPDTKAAMAGGFVANVANAVPAMASGPVGGALIMGGQTFGQVRADVEARRRTGQQISTTQELTAAGTQALLAGGLSFVQIKQLAATPAGAAFLREGVAKALQAYSYNAGISALQGNIQQLSTNIINNAVLGDNAPLEQGVGEATISGGILGGALTPLGAMFHGGGHPGEAVNNTPHGETLNGVPQIAPEALKSVTSEAPAVPEQGPILEAAQPKFRINDGATSRGVRVDFADSTEKALYVMGQPRQGKLAVEARTFLEAQGFDEAAITDKSAAVKARVEQASRDFTGDTLSIPKEVTNESAVVPPEPVADGVQPPEARLPNEANGTEPKVEPAASETGRPVDLDTRPGGEPALAGVGEKAEGESFLAQRTPPDVATAIAEAKANVKGFQHELPANREQVEMRYAFRKRGVELVYYSGEGRGVKLARNADNVLFINKKNVAGSLHEAVSHEFMHELKQTRPALYGEFAKAIPPEMLADAQKTYNEAFNKMRPEKPLTPEKLLEEGVATIFGKTSKDSRVVNEILGRNPTLWQKITDAVRSFAGKFSSKSRLVNQAVDTFRRTIENPVGGGSLEGMGETFEAGKGVKLAGQRSAAFETSPSRRMVIEPTEAPSFQPEEDEPAKGAGVPRNGPGREALDRMSEGLRKTLNDTAVERAGRNKDKIDALARKLVDSPEHPSKITKDAEGSFLPGEKFFDEDVKPAAEKIGKMMSDAVKGIRSLVAPFTASKDARTTGNVLRERGAELAQRFDRVNDVFTDARKFMEKMPVADTRDFIDRMEKGQKQTRPELQNMADAIRSILDDRLKQVQGLGNGKLAQFITDYFPHLWKDPKKAANAFAKMASSKAPLEGGKSFLKQRTLPLFSDGIAKGLEPITENPVEAAMLRVREMDKYITAQNAFKEMNGKGLLRKITAKTKLPDGYAEIADNIAKQFAPPSRRGAIQLQSRYVAPEAVANVINNYLSPGLRGNKHFGGAFRMYLGAGNMMNQVQLGLSGFHLLNTSLDSAASKLSLGMKQLAAGQFVESGKSILKSASLVGPALENMYQGTQIMREWKKPGSTTPEIAAIVDVMKAAGGRISMDDFYHTGMVDKMMEAWKKGNVIGAALRLPLAGLEMSAKPIMEKIVPRMKMGVFMDMAKFEMQKLGPGASRDEIREAAGKAWDSVDNRMGELVYDNLFWNKAVKDLAMASTRSVGWNLGTLRELGGGLLDFGKAGTQIVKGNPRAVEFTHRMAYTLAMPLLAGSIGGMVHYMLTGKHPEELKDWFFPKTGEKDKDGHDVRLALPSYMKDVLAYAKDPAKTLGDKVHPMLNTIFQMLSNQDYYGTKIANEDDPFMQRVLERVKFAGKQLVPFGVREAVQMSKEGQGAKSLLPLMGVIKARKDITNTPAELKASEINKAQAPVGGRTQSAADRLDLVRDFAQRLRASDPAVRSDMRVALKSGAITDSDIESIKDRIRHTGLSGQMQHMDLKDAMKVWDVSTPQERREIGPMMFNRLRTSKTLTRDERVTILKKLQADWKSLKAGAPPEDGEE